MLNQIEPDTTGNPNFIVIQYPPEYDGELHIWAFRKTIQTAKVDFTLRHAIKNNETDWENLVRAAKAIIAQDKRNKR